MAYFRKTALAITSAVVLFQGIDTQAITPSTCFDPVGYSACEQQTQSAATVCDAQAGSDQIAQAQCACDQDLAVIYCALQSCWNVVYGCEYQRLALNWDSVCLGNLGDIPFFPPPENAPGGCSCDFGQVLEYFDGVTSSYYACHNSAVGDFNKDAACGCCGLSGWLTSLVSICPTVSPTWGFFNATNEIADWGAQLPYCASSFQQYDCVNDLGYPSLGTVTYLTVFPASTGTLDPTTLAGSIATPLCDSGCVVTASGTTTIFPVSGAANAATSGGAAATSAPGGEAAAATTTTTTMTTTTSSNGSKFMSKSGSFLSLHLFVLSITIAWI